MDDEKNFQLFIDEITRAQDKEEDRLCDIRENKGFWNKKRQNYMREKNIKQKVFLTELKEINIKVLLFFDKVLNSH